MTPKFSSIPLLCAVSCALLLALGPTPALAYMGPGLGLGAIGSVIGVVAALLLGLASIVWYPLKRMLRRMRANRAKGTKL